MKRLKDLGFDPGRFAFAGRTALAACIAVLAAWGLGLEHPQWAGMTVWAASQPMRGQLLEKGFFRVAGTISGTVAGVLLVLASGVHPAFLVIGLALWVGACTLIGNLQRGFVSYGTVLAGYTAAMVALLDTGHPDRVLALGADRLATVLTGVAVAMAVGLLFAPPATVAPLHARIRGLLADLCDLASRGGDPEAARAILSELAAIEEQLDPRGAGSLRSRRAVKVARAVLIAALALLLHLRDLAPVPDPALAAAGAALRKGNLAAAREALEAARVNRPDLAEELVPLIAALTDWEAPETAEPPRPTIPVVLHRDWIGARESALRATGTLLLFGAIWLATGWHAGPFMLLGLSIMISLFSTFENPVALLPGVFVGQLFGIAGALACRWLAWPFASGEFQMILLMMPFILVGPLLVAHDRTTAKAFDYNMVMLLMLQPHYPLSGTFSSSLATGLAVVAAPLTALAAYRFVYPLSLKRRIDTLVAMMLRDLAALAADPEALAHRQVWRARLYHRTLRLVRLSERSAQAGVEAMTASLALLSLGQAAMRAHALVAAGGPTARAAQAALSRLARIDSAPERARVALDRLGRRAGGSDVALFGDAAARVGALPRAA